MAVHWRGRMLHCPGEREGGKGVEYVEDGVLAVEDGRIIDLLPAEKALRQGLAPEACRSLGKRLLVPGFIDTHIHAPQIDVIGSYGEQLLEWLERYTFPAEMRVADPGVATAVAESFIDELLRHGTTTALVFSSSHEEATERLFAAAARRRLCLVAGKVMMDRNAPGGLCDAAEAGSQACRRLIERWHGRDRLRYAVTPRFSITSTEAQLRCAGELLADYPGLYMQTHLAENTDEVAAVQRLFPDCNDYLETYERHGLCTERSVFAHCLHLDSGEIARLGAADSKVAFCPSSNLFLGSGLFDWRRFDEAGVEVSLATDVGGGTSFSMLATLGDAYKVCQLQGYSLSPLTAFYCITLGNARALGLEERVGNLVPGTDADFLILDPDATPLIKRRVEAAATLEDEWFTYMTLGDDRLVAETWVAGRCVKSGNRIPGTNRNEEAA